jgi:Uma2 family endonuclease
MPVLAPSRRPRGPAWEVAHLFPQQGRWTAEEYLDLNRRTNRPIELSHGALEVLPMPTRSHQESMLKLYDLLRDHMAAGGLGKVLVAPYPVRLKAGQFREPDLVVMLAAHLERLGEDFADGANMVVEILSKDCRKDLVIRRAEYGQAGIGEYWIVDPVQRSITVLRRSARRYVVHGVFRPGQSASSVLLKGFKADVLAVLDAGQ